jgi:DNA-binding MarR family transcriptional regulator
VRLSKHEVDKRRLQVNLTDEGRRAIEELVPLAKAISDETLSPLSAKDAETLLQLLTKIS